MKSQFFLIGCLILLYSSTIIPQGKTNKDCFSNASPPTTSKVKPLPTTPTKSKPNCSKEKMKEIRETATYSFDRVQVDCNCTLDSTDVITKRLIFEGKEASGATCNCNGAILNGGVGSLNYRKDMIEVRSKKMGATWERPENVTIQNCNIIGSVGIWGMGKYGEDTHIRESSKRKISHRRHIQRVRNNAPKNIVFDNITITGIDKTPLCFSPGVTYSKLINSEIKGKSSKAAIYLDEESAHNTIKGNYIHVKTVKDNKGEVGVKNRGWCQLAIDGSTHNNITNNRFAELQNGGIYLYQNCRERGLIQNTPPKYNIIVNNVFYYKNYGGKKPAIFLGSCDYGFKQTPFGYCSEGIPYSIIVKDNLRYNIVMQNQFYKRKIKGILFSKDANLSHMIEYNEESSATYNYINYNEVVSNSVHRETGCYVANGYKNFLLHGESLDVFKVDGKLTYIGEKVTCNDGELITTPASDHQITEVSFDGQE